MQLTQEQIISEATKLGIVNPTKVRNLKIKNRFKELRSAGNGYDKSLQLLSEEFFISEPGIRKIIHITK